MVSITIEPNGSSFPYSYESFPRKSLIFFWSSRTLLSSCQTKSQIHYKYGEPDSSSTSSLRSYCFSVLRSHREETEYCKNGFEQQYNGNASSDGNGNLRCAHIFFCNIAGCNIALHLLQAWIEKVFKHTAAIRRRSVFKYPKQSLLSRATLAAPK